MNFDGETGKPSKNGESTCLGRSFENWSNAPFRTGNCKPFGRFLSIGRFPRI